MSHGAQCLLCKHARWRGRNVVGCLAFEELALPTTAIVALTALTYEAAGRAPCHVRERLEVGPDAYLARDA